ncbi:MAG: hypothetical protein EOO90_22300 [Pedobacter sp.]|nr:MAG: hypothetical protein EOO90_22300 [Pedobacter sp.]
MKKLILLALTLFAYQANATVHTVNNNPNGGSTFKQIDEAIAVAVSGDTIFVQGSVNTYNNFMLTDKKIVFVGPGFAPDKNLPQIATIAGGTIRNTDAAGSSDGSEFTGLVFNGQLIFFDGFIGSRAVNNIVIKRCVLKTFIYIGSAGGSSTNFLIESNYFNAGGILGSTGSTYSNFIIRNNVFRGASPAIQALSNASDILVDHNLFYTNVNVFSACRFFLITNNIFYKANAGGGNNAIALSTYTNNIAFNGANNTPWLDGTNNVNGGGNLGATDPKIVANTALNADVDNPVLDFSVGAGPAKNAGSDGKDIGLLFDATGSLNWANARGARLPFIFSMNIVNPTIAPGVSLNVEVTAKKQN